MAGRERSYGVGYLSGRFYLQYRDADEGTRRVLWQLALELGFANELLEYVREEHAMANADTYVLMVYDDMDKLHEQKPMDVEVCDDRAELERRQLRWQDNNALAIIYPARRVMVG